jgi:hypothetical protein
MKLTFSLLMIIAATAFASEKTSITWDGYLQGFKPYFVHEDQAESQSPCSALAEYTIQRNYSNSTADVALISAMDDIVKMEHRSDLQNYAMKCQVFEEALEEYLSIINPVARD